MAQKRKKICLLSAAILLYSVAQGMAAPVNLPTDAGRVLRDSQLNERTLPKLQQPDLAVEQPEQQTETAPAGETVQVETITVTGQDIANADELTALYQEQLHHNLTLADIQQIAAKITKYFRDRGYLVAQAYLPAQEIVQGNVEIAVMIGRYGDVVLKNTSSAEDWVIRQQLTSLKPGGYINNRELERAVLLTGDLAGVAAKITLYPGKAVGTTDVIVEASDKTGVSRGSLSVNNWGNRFTGSNQGTVYYRIENTAHAGDSLNIGWTNAGSGLDSGYAGYRVPVAEGVALNLGYGKVRYSLGENYELLGAHGTAYTRHADLSWNITRSRTANVSLQAGYDHKRLEDLIDISAAVTKKRSHSTSLGLTGESLDNLWGGGMNSYALTWYDGSLSGEHKNLNAPPTGDWQKTTFSLLRRQSVNKRLSTLFTFSGQTASTNLDSSEKFSLGGANGVRAYPANEASGDEGWMMTGELHWTLPVSGSKGSLELIGFYDGGVSHIEKSPTFPVDNRRVLAAKGLGLNWTVPNQYAVKVHYAWKAGSAPATSDNDKSGRLWLQGVTYF